MRMKRNDNIKKLIHDVALELKGLDVEHVKSINDAALKNMQTIETIHRNIVDRLA